MGRRTGQITLVSKPLKVEPLATWRRRILNILKYESKNIELRTWAALTSLFPFLIALLWLHA
jgi:hypothetical protein